MKTETELWDACTRLLETSIEQMAVREKLGPADVVVILTMAIGRIAGKMGYRHLNCKQYWDEVCKSGKALFALGFESERNPEKQA